jgi:hypothetical protein
MLFWSKRAVLSFELGKMQIFPSIQWGLDQSASVNIGHEATASRKSVSLHEANVPSQSPQTVAHDAAFSP